MRSFVPVAVIVLAVAALSCAAGRGESRARTVSEADLGRLRPGQLAPLDVARADEMQARDDVARAQLRASDARHELGYADADRTAAVAAHQRATAETAAARDSNDPAALGRAQELMAAADVRSRAADAHADYARRVVAARQAEVAAAQARVGLADAGVERAKLTALDQAGIPAARKYDPAPLDARVASARSAWDQAHTRALNAERGAEASLDRWRQLVAQYQALTQGVGTGSGGTGTAPEGAPGAGAPEGGARQSGGGGGQ